jgi:hypothetical protein
MKRFWRLSAVSFWVFLIAVLAPATHAQEPQDVIARVGDQTISLHEIDTMINSSSVVGLDIPAPGTTERNAARLSLLDKMISADLLYLDAIQSGLDKNPDYQQKVKNFSNDILASLYNEKVLKGELPVTEAEVKDFYKKNIAPGTELTDDVKLSIESTIRKQKYKARNEGMRQKIRQGARVAVVSKELEPAGDSARAASAIVARVNNEEIHWGEVKALMTSTAGKDLLKKRMNALDGVIDERIMTAKAREMGLEKDPVFQARVNEFKKTSLITLHQGMLFKKFSPQDAEVRSLWKNKQDHPAEWQCQMVLKTRKEAGISRRISIQENDLSTARFSIDLNAKNFADYSNRGPLEAG